MKNFNPMPVLLFGVMPVIFGGSYTFGHFYSDDAPTISIIGATQPAETIETQEETFELIQDITTGSGAYVRLSDDETQYEWTAADGSTGTLAVDKMGFTNDPSSDPSLTCTHYPNNITQCVYTGPTDILSVEALT